MTDADDDLAALQAAATHYDIDPTEPGAEEWLRGSPHYRWTRFGLAARRMGTTRREARHVIATIFWRLDTFRLRTRWWDLTPWWTTHQPCGCMTRHRRYRALTCLNHALEDFHLDEEDGDRPCQVDSLYARPRPEETPDA